MRRHNTKVSEQNNALPPTHNMTALMRAHLANATDDLAISVVLNCLSDCG
jgi:hypothetical protein